jgi:site-specific DNA-methyltransferase (adenine-specific)
VLGFCLVLNQGFVKERGELVFDPICGSGTTAVAAKELNRSFAGAELEREFCGLAARRIGATERGVVLREIRDPGWGRG